MESIFPESAESLKWLNALATIDDRFPFVEL
jgi:hypothetical protein